MPDDMRLPPREEQAKRLALSLRRQLGELGCGILREPGVFELMLNPSGELWEDRHGAGMRCVGRVEESAAESFIGTVASMLRVEVNRETPILECELPDDEPFFGARFEAMLPPVVLAPTFTIRLRAAKLYTLAEYVDNGVMTAKQRGLIEEAVRSRKNIMVFGGTSSGKTTLLNAILEYMSRAVPEHRIILMEDTIELQPKSPNVVALRTTATIGMQRLLMATMRLRPDRIIVGEVRNGAALDLLKAWNTGHPGGLGTAHSNDAHSGLIRLEQMIAEVSATPMPVLIGQAIDLILFVANTPEGRRVREVLAVKGYEKNRYITENLEQ